MITPKKKLCIGPCGQLKYIWARGMCKECDSKNKPKSIPKKKTPIPKLSPKRKLEQAEYLKLRLEFLNTNRKCQVQINSLCSKNATQVHHMAGRIGKLYLDTTKWLAVCGSCHSWIELHPVNAKVLGFSLDRL